MKNYKVTYEVNGKWRSKMFNNAEDARAFIKSNMSKRGTSAQYPVDKFWNSWYVEEIALMDSVAFMNGKTKKSKF